ncbi:phosphoglyceromutase [Mycena metata]|uniref:Phosphoglyceromutase n=1 Tax=Mycena metata TaxID=1033252 RepID=A0AAD7GKS7_9AGAR|nr:phosphoglyceromutase [Mycena metata]
MIPSPKVAMYDLKPEMSVQDIADKVASIVESKEYNFVMCNFAPPDLVGHTGNFDAAVSAITHTDAAVGTVYTACQAASYVLLITADHGNAEQMRNAETRAPHTAHTCNPVPFILAGPESAGYVLVPDDVKVEDEEEGGLCDVAPTVLEILDLDKPEVVSAAWLLH